MNIVLSQADSKHLDRIVELHWKSFQQAYASSELKPPSEIYERIKSEINSGINCTVALDDRVPAGYVLWDNVGVILGGIISGAVSLQKYMDTNRKRAEHILDDIDFLLKKNSANNNQKSKTFQSASTERKYSLPKLNHLIDFFDSRAIIKYQTAVEPGYRKRGIATKLTEFVLSKAQEKNAQQVFTFCYLNKDENSPDQGMFAVNLKKGFYPILVFKEYYADHADAILMGKNVST